MSWRVNVLTIYPEMFPGPLSESLSGKALEKGIWSLNVLNIRDYGLGKHSEVDDKPYGGGPGMIIRADVLDRAIKEGLEKIKDDLPLVYLSPKGRLLNQKTVNSFAQGKGVSIICGHFEGIDQRVLEVYNIEEISIGDYILSGGEIASMVFLDSIVRTLPGVMGNAHSVVEESLENNLLEYPQYTKPQNFKGVDVPDVLLSGDHEAIRKWRFQKSLEITKKQRPELLKNKKD